MPFRCFFIQLCLILVPPRCVKTRTEKGEKGAHHAKAKHTHICVCREGENNAPMKRKKRTKRNSAINTAVAGTGVKEKEKKGGRAGYIEEGKSLFTVNGASISYQCRNTKKKKNKSKEFCKIIILREATTIKKQRCLKKLRLSNPQIQPAEHLILWLTVIGASPHRTVCSRQRFSRVISLSLSLSEGDHKWGGGATHICFQDNAQPSLRLPERLLHSKVEKRKPGNATTGRRRRRKKKLSVCLLHGRHRREAAE